jgi:hypothetical protein
MPSSGRKPPPRHVRTQQERARLGVAIASALAFVFVVIIAWVFLTMSGGPRRPSAIQPPPAQAARAGTEANSQGELVGAKRTQIALHDQSDPTRIAGRLVFESMDPLEARNYAVDMPDGWIYPRDGGAIHVRAQSGRLYMPDRSREPESGRLAGNVVIDFYRKRADGKPVDEANDKPDATFKTRALNFDSTLGSVTSSDPFTLVSEQADLSGTGLDMLFNRAAQRLEMLQITHGEALVIHPDRARSRPEASAAPAPKPTQIAEASSAPEPATSAKGASQGKKQASSVASPDVFYHATFNEGVTMTQDARSIEADLLSLWAHTIDGKLPAGAIAPVRVAKTPTNQLEKHADAGGQTPPAWLASPGSNDATRVPATPASMGAAAPRDSSAHTPASPADLTVSPGDIVLKWSGLCVVQPLEASPDELARDLVALRFSANPDRVVHARDATHRALIEGDTIAYGATSRRLILTGRDAKPASIDLPETGQGQAARIEADLTSGLIHLPGPSEFVMADRSVAIPGPIVSPSDFSSRLSCTQQADLTLDVVDGEVTSTLRQAAFAGDVRIAQKDSSLQGQFVRTDFVTVGARPSVLSRLVVQGGADMGSTRDASAGQIQADSIDVSFNTSSASSSPEPRAVTAERRVRVQRAGEHLNAEFLEATLAPNDRGATDVVAARATGAIEYANLAQGVSMKADEMRGDFAPDASLPGKRRQIIDLTGERVTLARGDETSVLGTQMRLEGEGPRIHVFGPGEFTHRQDQPATENAREKLVAARATWTGGMTFDDATGVLTCDGNAVANASPDAYTRDRFEGEHVTVTLAPRSVATTVNDGASGTSREQRQVVSARATGSILDRDGGTNAHVESRRYVQPVPAGVTNEALPALEQAVYLEGPTIAADNTTGTLDVPEAGRLLLRDARERARSADGPSGGPSPDGRGDALFDWDGSMKYRRETGQIEMTRNVRLTHRRMQDALVTNLRCDKMIAGVNVPAPGQPASKNERPQLTSVNATGSVYVSSGSAGKPGQPAPAQRELSADMVDYDTVRSIVAARANPGAFVSFLDTARGSPVTAASIVWNLIEDRITVDAPQPITAPR